MFSRVFRPRIGLLAALLVVAGLIAAPAAAQDPVGDVDELLQRYQEHLEQLEQELQARSAAAQARLEATVAAASERQAELEHRAQAELEARLAAEQRRLREVEAAVAGQRDGRRPIRHAPGVHLSRVGPRGFLGMDSGADWVLAHAEELELTEEQEERIREAERAYRRAEIERDADIEVAELDLEDLLQDEYDADLAAVEEQMRMIADLRVADRVARLRLRQQIHDVLTAQQQEKLEEMRPDRLHARLLMGDGPGAWRFRAPPGERFELRGGGPEVWRFRGEDLELDMPHLRERMERLFDEDGHFRFFHFEHDEHMEEEEGTESDEGEGQVDGAARGTGGVTPDDVVVTL